MIYQFNFLFQLRCDFCFDLSLNIIIEYNWIYVRKLLQHPYIILYIINFDPLAF